MVRRKFVDLFEIKNLACQNFLPYLVYFSGKMNFFYFFTKTLFMDKTRTICKKWLVNELDLSFRAPKKSVLKSNLSQLRGFQNVKI